MPFARDALLIDLYRLSRGVPPADFSDAALRLVASHLPFDSALWGRFALTPEGPHQHTVHLFGLAMEMLAELISIQPYNVVYERTAANPGRTTNTSLERVQHSVAPAAIAVGRRLGLLHALATVIEEPALNLFTILTLHRNESRHPFSERERRYKQGITPHLVAAWRINTIQFVDGPAQTARRLGIRALVAPQGELSVADPELVELMREEVRGWRGPQLPDALLPLARGNTEVFRGTAIVASLVRRLDDGSAVIGVRRRNALDELSARELEVAREFASGKSHKEIAALCGTSPTTVRSQLRAVYAKLGVSTKVELLRQMEAAR
ncbi:MAG TPA: LuxR C-terminal-related transcriptional regulator [Casimicrobiaceae bacterium]|nr:LuxR C-terminal-related transcriptional regulator [Myxococcota bacterium]HTS23013.1 LuxR C-terminal-related transcriptional regulator [Casimicrobiaceae bacterium]